MEEKKPIGVVVNRGFAGSLWVQILDNPTKVVVMYEGDGPGKVTVDRDEYGIQYVYVNERS